MASFGCVAQLGTFCVFRTARRSLPTTSSSKHGPSPVPLLPTKELIQSVRDEMELRGRGQRVEWFQHHKAAPISRDIIRTDVLDESQPAAEQELGDADRQTGLELDLDAHQVVFIQVKQLAAARVPRWLSAACSGYSSLVALLSGVGRM